MKKPARRSIVQFLTVLGMAVMLSLGPSALAANDQEFEDKLFPGFRYGDDQMFKEIAAAVFHDITFRNRVNSSGYRVDALSSLLRNVTDWRLAIKEETILHNPAFWLVVARLGEEKVTYNYSEITPYEDAMRTYERHLSPEMKEWAQGINKDLQKHHFRQRISYEEIDRHYIAAMAYAAFRGRTKTNEEILLFVNNYLETPIDNLAEKKAFHEEIFDALNAMGVQPKSLKNELFERQLIVTWASHILSLNHEMILNNKAYGLELVSSIERPMNRTLKLRVRGPPFIGL